MLRLRPPEMATERKVCCYCTCEGHRSHACPKRKEPYRFASVSSPFTQYSAAKANWIESNPGATSEEIEEASRLLAERLGV